MGILDRFRRREQQDSDFAPPPVDREARTAQLDELEQALRQLARAMSADEARMTNPGWRGRVEDYQWAATEAAKLSGRDFSRSELLDLANQVRPLYPPGTSAPPPEYLVFEAEQDRLVSAVQVLRAPLDSETAPTEQDQA